jgi:hypothetical protein
MGEDEEEGDESDEDRDRRHRRDKHQKSSDRTQMEVDGQKGTSDKQLDTKLIWSSDRVTV